MSDLLAAAALVLGGAFMLLSAVGVVRMPDVYMRLQVASKASSLGAGLFMLAVAIHFAELDIVVRALLVVAFIFLTTPVSAHLLGRAAYLTGVPLWGGSGDDALRGVAVSLQGLDEGAGGVVEGLVEAPVLVVVVLRRPVPQAAHDEGVDAHEDRHGSGQFRRLRQARDVGGDAPGVHILGAEKLADGVAVEHVDHVDLRLSRRRPVTGRSLRGSSVRAICAPSILASARPCGQWTRVRSFAARLSVLDSMTPSRLCPASHGEVISTARTVISGVKATARGGETMGPVPFYKTRVKHEERRAK